MSDLPRVCVVNGEDRNDDLDSVDPNIKCMLQGKGKRQGTAPSFLFFFHQHIEILITIFSFFFLCLPVKTISLQAALDAAIIAPVDAVLTLCHAKVDGQLLDKLGGKVGLFTEVNATLF